MTYPSDPQQPYGTPPPTSGAGPSGGGPSSGGPSSGGPYDPGAQPPASAPPAFPSSGQPGGGQDPQGQAPYGQTPYGQAPYGQPSYGQPPYGQAAYGQPSAGQGPHGQAPYGQAPYGQAPYGQPPQGQPPFGQPGFGQPGFGQPPKKSSGGKIALIVIGGVVALCLIFGVVGALVFSGNDSDSGTASDPGGYSFSPPAVTSGVPEPDDTGSAATGSEGTLNQPIRDGGAEFTLKSVKCGVAEVGQYAKHTAKGQYCLADATLKNVGNENISLVAAGASDAITESGQSYEADTAATVASNKDSSKFLGDVNPGSSVDITVAWDIPKDQKIAKVQLYESFGSPGVVITVS